MDQQTPLKIPIQDERCAQACEWAAARLGDRAAEFVVASADASFRRYFRARDARGSRSWIVMDAPPDRENLDAFVVIAARLRNAGLNAPEVLAEDRERGFLLLNDLGRKTFLDVLDERNADRLFDAAIDALVRMQSAVPAGGLPDYDAALLRRELDLYPDWYLARHRRVTLDRADRATWEDACERLVAAALAQPQVFVHRDFMPRNLMVSEPLPGVIDFQDAVRGPVTYDVLSLFKDAFMSWPATRIGEWLREYCERAIAAGVPQPDDFVRAFDLMGLQRHLKVIGIFARLNYRDGKAKYLAETPRFFDYVYETGARYAEFGPLLELMRRHEDAA